MKIRDLMTDDVIGIDPNETVEVAARTLTRYNIGVLPVCTGKKLCGLVTDRDIVTRCLASGKNPGSTPVREVMTSGVVSVSPEADAAMAARLMGQKQIRRLPVVENGALCGMVSIGDLAKQEEMAYDAGDALADISGNVSRRD